MPHTRCPHTHCSRTHPHQGKGSPAQPRWHRISRAGAPRVTGTRGVANPPSSAGTGTCHSRASTLMQPRSWSAAAPCAQPLRQCNLPTTVPSPQQLPALRRQQEPAPVWQGLSKRQPPRYPLSPFTPPAAGSPAHGEEPYPPSACWGWPLPPLPWPVPPPLPGSPWWKLPSCRSPASPAPSPACGESRG